MSLHQGLEELVILRRASISSSLMASRMPITMKEAPKDVFFRAPLFIFFFLFFHARGDTGTTFLENFLFGILGGHTGTHSF